MMNSEENDGIDRISSLPDETRTHILSFLSTREAVQTCILSKRWINTWAFVTDLKFDIKEFGLPPKIVDGKMAKEFVTKFQLLVRSVLEKRETSCVNRFQLSLDSLVYWPRTQAVADCIGDVMKLSPRECLVEMGSCENLTLNTDLIFTCASLIFVQLCLSNKGSIPLVAIKPNFVNLPRLKTIVLYDATMSDDFFKKLFLGCPMLEEIVLESCYLKDTIKICSNTLKKLVLHKCCDVRGLHISAPNLLYLDMKVFAIGEILLLNMPSLVDASSYISCLYDQGKYLTRGAILLLNIPNVESLRLQFVYPDKKVWRIKGCLDQHPITREGLRDPLVQQEFLKTVRIVGFEDDNEFVDWLIKKLHAHVKIIGEIIV
ncbi:F-box/LRR-repeat protein At3g58900-like isoform X2 [Carex rostrata]